MGNKTSQLEAQLVGYRVLGVQPFSPAAKAGLVSFFDFIIACNNVLMRDLDANFVDIIQAHEDKPLLLTVFNWKAKTQREVVVTPTKKWPGDGMLGVTIRFDTYHNAEEHICHVLDIEPNSPAELCGLQAYDDYLLGIAEKAFQDVDILHEVLEANINHPIEVYVYNAISDEVRTVVILPNCDWGGDGILGASVAQGLLHILPSSCCETIGKSGVAIENDNSIPTASK